MEIYTLVHGKMDENMEKVNLSMPMVVVTKVNIFLVSSMVQESENKSMDLHLKEHGEMVRNMVKDYMKISNKIYKFKNGKMIY
jgi:hypothetical protein